MTKEEIVQKLVDLGYQPISNNNLVHIHFRLGRHVVDIWQSTSRFKLKKFINKYKFEVELFSDFESLLKAIELLRTKEHL